MKLNNLVLHSNIQVDFAHIEISSTDNQNIFVDRYIPSLNNNSVILVSYEDNNRNGEGVTDSALGHTFSVYKEENNNNELEYVTTISEGNLSISDYNIANQKDYRYYVFKENEEISSAANISNSVRTCWWDWSITGLTKSDSDDNVYYTTSDDVWKFTLNVESADSVRNFNKTEYNNLTKYPKVSIGKLNYCSGGLTCLIGSIRNNQYIDTVEMLDAWNNFCTDGSLKILKDRKGNKMFVEIMSSQTNIQDETKEQVNTITFNWIQIGDANNVTIVGR